MWSFRVHKKRKKKEKKRNEFFNGRIYHTNTTNGIEYTQKKKKTKKKTKTKRRQTKR